MLTTALKSFENFFIIKKFQWKSISKNFIDLNYFSIVNILSIIREFKLELNTIFKNFKSQIYSTNCPYYSPQPFL